MGELTEWWLVRMHMGKGVGGSGRLWVSAACMWCQRMGPIPGIGAGTKELCKKGLNVEYKCPIGHNEDKAHPGHAPNFFCKSATEGVATDARTATNLLALGLKRTGTNVTIQTLH